MKRHVTIVIVLILVGGICFAAGMHYAASTRNATPRITGIGGIFFKVKDPAATRSWYAQHFGMQTDKYGTNFLWYQGADSTHKGFTQWSPFGSKTKYFAPSPHSFMINYRVQGIEALIAKLSASGIKPLDTLTTYDYGKFIHYLDPDSNKIELWEPIDEIYHKYSGALTY